MLRQTPQLLHITKHATLCASAAGARAGLKICCLRSETRTWPSPAGPNQLSHVTCCRLGYALRRWLCTAGQVMSPSSRLFPRIGARWDDFALVAKPLVRAGGRVRQPQTRRSSGSARRPALCKPLPAEPRTAKHLRLQCWQSVRVQVLIRGLRAKRRRL